MDPSGIVSTLLTAGRPDFLSVDALGNLYVSESLRIRKISPSGAVTVVAGTGIGSTPNTDGVPATTSGVCPRGVAVDHNSNIYIADFCVGRIRKVDSSGIIQSVAGTATAGFSGDSGPATQAALSREIHGVAVDQAGNFYFADGQRIRKVDTRGIITTIAGDGQYGFSGDHGPATSAALQAPRAAVADAAGNIYIADTDNHRIRQVDANGLVTTIAGTGEERVSGEPSPGGRAATSVRLSLPAFVALDRFGNLYFPVRTGVGSALGTVHSGAFESGADDHLAARFDYP